jgi:hypothetical protein
LAATTSLRSLANNSQTKLMKILHLFTLIVALAPALAGQTILTGFGTGQFTLDTDNSILLSSSQSATALTISVNDQSGAFAGLFPAPVNISGQSNSLVFTATVTGTNPASNFQLQLYDGNGFFSFNGNWSSFVTGASTSVTLPASDSSSFDFANVQGFQLLFGGTGNVLNVTFDQLASIPEPTTFALVAGMSALGLCVARRRFLSKWQVPTR